VGQRPVVFHCTKLTIRYDGILSDAVHFYNLSSVPYGMTWSSMCTCSTICCRFIYSVLAE